MIYKIVVTVLVFLIVAIMVILAADINPRYMPKNDIIIKKRQPVKSRKIKTNTSVGIVSSLKTYNKISRIKSNQNVSKYLPIVQKINLLNLNKDKPIFDSTLYKDKNPKNKSFFIPIKVLGSNILVGKNGSINLHKLTKLAKSLSKSQVPYILDIEMWNVGMLDDIQANKNIDKYILVINTMKKARPDLKFGYYGVLPNRDYWSPVLNNPQKIKKWHHINKRLKRLARYVDVICPSLYTFYNNQKGWKKYAIENIKQAKIYKKPVYPFLWPQYHDSNKKLRGIYISPSFWFEELALVLQSSNGVIVWGGWNNGRVEWNENAPWWKITKVFAKR